MTYPPIPRDVMGVLGPIRVLMVDLSPEDDERCGGIWYAQRREIQVQRSGDPANEWWVLHHEIMHAILDDLCVELPHRQLEAVCNAYGTARLLEMQGRIGIRGSM